MRPHLPRLRPTPPQCAGSAPWCRHRPSALPRAHRGGSAASATQRVGAGSHFSFVVSFWPSDFLPALAGFVVLVSSDDSSEAGSLAADSFARAVAFTTSDTGSRPPEYSCELTDRSN